jgi:glycosyltransferase involved in cell wall biosynthesis
MSNSQSLNKPVLLCVSGTIASDIKEQIGSGMRPRADYLELARALNADLVDYPSARAATGRFGAILERFAGANLLLALACWMRRKQYQAIVTDGEQIGLPLAVLLKLTPGKRPRHIMIVHVLSVPKKMLFLDWFSVQSCIDRFVTYSHWQKQFIEQRWQLRAERVIWTPFMVDQHFFAPHAVKPQQKQRPQICAVGLERRDYPTLLQAVEGLDVDVVIAAASPWSKIKDTTSQQTLPRNVTVKNFSQYDLRQLYADSQFLVMPLQPVDFQAGITAILEAMAMGKAVICSKVPGQTDAVSDGVNGTYVTQGNPAALRAAILSMLADTKLTCHMGENGRKRVENQMNLDRYTEGLAKLVYETIDAGAPAPNSSSANCAGSITPQANI